LTRNLNKMGQQISFVNDYERYAAKNNTDPVVNTVRVVNTVIKAYNKGESGVFVSADSSREEEYCNILKNRLGWRIKSCYKDPRDDGIFVDFADYEKPN